MRKVLIVTIVLLLSASLLFADGNIDRNRAQEIAIADAGVDPSTVRSVRSSLDREDGIRVYDVEFRVDYVEYSYEIEASTGNILSADRDMNIWPSGRTDVTITEDEAIAAAYTDAGVSSSDTIRVRLGWDDGAQEYDIEFTSGDWKYDYKLDAADGTILEAGRDRIMKAAQPTSRLSIDEAAALVLERIDGATRDNMRIRQSRDDGRIVYEGQVRYNGYEYEFEIDAATGRFTDWERERDDWD